MDLRNFDIRVISLRLLPLPNSLDPHRQADDDSVVKAKFIFQTSAPSSDASHTIGPSWRDIRGDVGESTSEGNGYS